MSGIKRNVKSLKWRMIFRKRKVGQMMKTHKRKTHNPEN